MTSTASAERVVMASGRAGQASPRMAALLCLAWIASAAVTIAWGASMSAMGGMPMPGGWTMSMTWMRMPGQTWPGAAASFLGMWIVMMVAMMLPSLVPMLWRYRELRRQRREAPRLADGLRRPRATSSSGPGWEWRSFRSASRWRRSRCSSRRCARAVPLATGRRRADRGKRAVHRVEGASACLLPRGSRAAAMRSRPAPARPGSMAFALAFIAFSAAPARRRFSW